MAGIDFLIECPQCFSSTAIATATFNAILRRMNILQLSLPEAETLLGFLLAASSPLPPVLLDVLSCLEQAFSQIVAWSSFPMPSPSPSPFKSLAASVDYSAKTLLI